MQQTVVKTKQASVCYMNTVCIFEWIDLKKARVLPPEIHKELSVTSP